MPEPEKDKLRHTLTELSAIHEHAPIVMLLVDEDRRICNVNGFAAEFAGRGPPEMIGMRGGEALRCLNHLDDPQGCGFGPACAECNLRQAVLGTLETGISRHNVVAWLPYLHNGVRMERCLLISTAFLENQGAKKVLVCAQDITECKLAVEALRQSEQRLSAVLETQQEMICRFLPDTTLTFVNDAYCRIFGMSADKLLGRKFLELVPAAEHEIILAKLSKIDKNNRILMYTHPVTKKDGTTGWQEWTDHAILDAQGRAVEFQSVGRDITRQKEAEEEKAKFEAQNRQLKKAESLSRMAGAIAHHYNNLLSVVIGNLELATADLADNSGVTRYLTEAVSAARRASEMGGLMLAYLGQENSSRDLIDLSEACRRCLRDLSADMPAHVKVKTDMPSPGPVVNAGFKRIHRILINLCTNALEAVDEQSGEISLRVQTVSAGDIAFKHRFPIEFQPRSADYACLEITDNGSGIPDADLENIFDPFYSTRFTGRGLGLPVVLGIVKAHDGCITVESGPGRGSIFRVYLPMADDIAIRPADQEIKHPTLPAGLTVLVVDDEDQVRKMAATMLRHFGMKVLEARDGAEAVKVFRRNMNEIDCVLCDLTMPRMNGWETIAALRKLSPGIPAILTSGYDEAGVMSDIHAERPQVFLAKPYRMAALKDALVRTLRPPGNR